MLLLAAPAAAQTGITGNWSGTYSLTISLSSCQNKTFNWSGNVSASLLQNTTGVMGRLDMTNFTFISSSCTTSTGEFTQDVFGTTNGTSLALAVPNDPNGWQLLGDLAGDTITLQLNDANGLTGTLNLQRAPTQPITADFTGSWSGNYSFSDVCPSGSGKISYSGNSSLVMTQVGNAASGVMFLAQVPLYDQNCSTIAKLDTWLSVAGSVSGSTFTGAAFDPSGSFDFPFTATIGSSGLSGNATGFSATSTTGTFTMTQASAQTPASDFSGRFEGTYDETDDGETECFNVGLVPFSGTASVVMNQAGNAVAGALILEDTLTIVSDGLGDCAVLDGGEQVLPFYGTISNGTVNLTAPVGGGAANFAFTLSGDTITGTMQDSFGDAMQFSVKRDAGLPAPSAGPRRHVVRH